MPTSSLTPGGAASFVLTQALRAGSESRLGLQENLIFPPFAVSRWNQPASQRSSFILKLISSSSGMLRYSLCPASGLCILQGIAHVSRRAFQGHQPLPRSASSAKARRLWPQPLICFPLENPRFRMFLEILPE